MRRRSVSVTLLALALAVPAPALRADPARIAVRILVARESADSILEPAALLRAVRLFVSRQWPSQLEVSTDTGDAAAVISVARSGGTITITTQLSPGSGERRTLRSTLPLASAPSLVPTIAGDLTWLWLSSRSFAGLEPASPPALAAVLETDALAPLAEWQEGELEPLAIASSEEGITILFPRRWLTLGPLFGITRATMRDLLLQGEPSAALYASIARGARGHIVMTRDDGSVEDVDPLLGERTIAGAPAGSSVAGGRLAATLSASDVDSEGNRWSWDARERRVRVTGPDGGEVFSIRPLARSDALPIVQALAVMPDGGFLLGGSGELWRFSDTGVPAWRMTRLAGMPVEALPASFAIAVDRATGGFWLLDGPSRRILAYAADGGATSGAAAEPGTQGGEPAVELARHLGRMDARKEVDLDRALQLALAAGTPLAASRFASRLQRLGTREAPSATSAVELALMRDQARAAAGLVEELAAELLDARAAQAAERGVELARALRDRSPADPDAARLLESLTARRRDLREASSSQPDAPSVVAAAEPAWSGCGGTLSVSVAVEAPASSSLGDIRLSLGFPGLGTVPASATVGSLAPGEAGEATMVLALRELPVELPAAATAAILVSWQRPAGVGVSSLVLRVPIAARPALGDADDLACIGSSPDPFISSELDGLVGGPSDDAPGTLLALDILARTGQAARSQAGPAAVTAASGEPAVSFPSPRSLLRSLPVSGPQWSVLAAAVLASRQQPVGIVPCGDELLVVADTGLRLDKVLADRRVPAATASVLRSLSRSGALCLPLAGPGVPAPGARPTGLAGAVAEGLRRLASSRSASLAVSWVEPGGRPVARPGFSLPIALPTAASAAERGTLISDLLSALER